LYLRRRTDVFRGQRFQNEPKRCKGCKAKRAEGGGGGGGNGGQMRSETKTPARNAKGNHSSLPPHRDARCFAGSASSSGERWSGLGGKNFAKIDEKNAMFPARGPFFPKIIPIEVKFILAVSGV